MTVTLKSWQGHYVTIERLGRLHYRVWCDYGDWFKPNYKMLTYDYTRNEIINKVKQQIAAREI